MTIGSCSVQAEFSASQNSPSLVAPSPIDRYVTSSLAKWSARPGIAATFS
jgi:hypothetical protein